MFEWREAVRKAVAQSESQFFEISDYIFEHPELGDQEYESSAYLVKVLQEAGFTVQYPCAGLDTAFRADLKTGEGPTIAFIAEYDALPGYGPEKKPGHACGHNWIAAITAGAGIALAKMKEQFSGTVSVIGTPAEEGPSRKPDMIAAGIFDDVDAAFQMHLYEESNLKARALALGSMEFEFIGRASHAAVHPEEGINALDAVNLTYTAIGLLRQQLQDDVRIHGIINAGGDAPNTIPDRCKCQFFVRAARKSYFLKVYERVKNCARGAALMTGTQLIIHETPHTLDDLVVNPVLAELMEKCMYEAGFEPLSQIPEVPGSTDIGNLSYACPTLYGNVGIAGGKAKVHEEEFVKYANSEEAKRRIVMTVEAFLHAAMELYHNPELVREVRESYLRSIAD